MEHVHLGAKIPYPRNPLIFAPYISSFLTYSASSKTKKTVKVFAPYISCFLK
jgi:hypothetical protein